MFFESLLSVFNFGKFKGCELGEVLMCSPEYVEWVIENVNGSICAFSDNTIKEINLIFPSFVFSDDMMNRIKEQQEEYYENKSDGIENIIYEVEDW